MKHAPTLADFIYRHTFSNRPITGWKDNSALRERIIGAHKFVLSEPMSAFLGELGTRAFVPSREMMDNPSVVPLFDKAARVEVMNRQVEALRVSAFAPHRYTWIEYDLRAAMKRSNALLERSYNPSESPEREGWLIERHPELSTAFRLHVFTMNTSGKPENDGNVFWTFPVTYTWTIDDGVPPWRRLFKREFDREKMQRPDSAVATGVLAYESDSVVIAQSELMTPIWEYASVEPIVDLIREWVGVLRRCWALLATINDLPLTYGETRAAKGFVAKGRYRRFLDHTTITINVPQKEQTKVARNVIALARRRGHHVREHWRDDWRNPPSKRCPAYLQSGLHAWTAEQRCELCGGRRFRIHEHERGDASLGYVTHGYNVEHKEPTP